MKSLVRLAAAPGLCCLRQAALARFASTEVFLPAVGRIAGNGGAQFFTTVWATNLTGVPETFTFQFLKQGQANAIAHLLHRHAPTRRDEGLRERRRDEARIEFGHRRGAR